MLFLSHRLRLNKRKRNITRCWQVKKEPRSWKAFCHVIIRGLPERSLEVGKSAAKIQAVQASTSAKSTIWWGERPTPPSSFILHGSLAFLTPFSLPTPIRLPHLLGSFLLPCSAQTSASPKFPRSFPEIADSLGPLFRFQNSSDAHPLPNGLALGLTECAIFFLSWVVSLTDR